MNNNLQHLTSKLVLEFHWGGMMRWSYLEEFLKDELKTIPLNILLDILKLLKLSTSYPKRVILR